MLFDRLKNYEIILATRSPRRHQLMKGAGFDFEIVAPKDEDESYPDYLSVNEVAKYLAKKKALPLIENLNKNEILITADTIVILENKVLGKPSDIEEARKMLNDLSGKTHVVETAVCLAFRNNIVIFNDITKVHFRSLLTDEIEYYVNNYKPFDKAGSYGAQEWIGYIAIEHIEGSYFNVMGLPIDKVYTELDKFITAF